MKWMYLANSELQERGEDVCLPSGHSHAPSEGICGQPLFLVQPWKAIFGAVSVPEAHLAFVYRTRAVYECLADLAEVQLCKADYILGTPSEVLSRSSAILSCWTPNNRCI